MDVLTYDEKIPFIDNDEYKIINYIGEGGQAYIYTTTNAKIIKWYKKEFASKKMKDNIQKLIKDKSPAPNITWPLSLTKDYKGSFGYIMPRIPPSYVSLKKYIYEDKYNLNFEEMVQIAYATAATFKAIHDKGYVYQDINPGSIFIDKSVQKVIICDVDNCNKEGKIFVSGTPTYRAPEIVTGKTNPNLYTDYYSLGVILFRLFYNDHPLEGKRTWSTPSSDEEEIEFFGKNPLFVCDPINLDNGFYKDCTLTVEKRWGRYFPKTLENAFIKTFTTGLIYPQSRLTDQEWMNVLKQCNNQLVKKKISGVIKQAFFPLSTDKFLKIKMIKRVILISEYKKIYAYLFDENAFFTKILFECLEENKIVVRNDELFINGFKKNKNDVIILKEHDVIEYHHIKATVEV